MRKGQNGQNWPEQPEGQKAPTIVLQRLVPMVAGDMRSTSCEPAWTTLPRAVHGWDVMWRTTWRRCRCVAGDMRSTSCDPAWTTLPRAVHGWDVMWRTTWRRCRCEAARDFIWLTQHRNRQCEHRSWV